FQAEDGIRDFHVTGVQTCALPISKAVQAARYSSVMCAASRRITLLAMSCEGCGAVGGATDQAMASAAATDAAVARPARRRVRRFQPPRACAGRGTAAAGGDAGRASPMRA